MLGALARWLRVLGVDTVYDPALDDPELVGRALAEGRTLLTRDRRLVERRALDGRHLLIASEVVDDQVRQVLAALGLAPGPADLFRRCLRCNAALEETDAETARRLVPPFVARTQERFRRCPACDRLYWRGTHALRMRRRLQRMGVLAAAPPGVARSPLIGWRPAMKRTLFDPECRAGVVARLRRLTPDTPRRWGTMSAPRMVAHLTDQMYHCLGDRPCTPVRSVLRWAPLRYATIYLVPWPKGRAKGPPDAFLTQPGDWDADLANLIGLVERFGARDPAGEWVNHALLGPMRGTDWGCFCHKHFDHHLRQFGQ